MASKREDALVALKAALDTVSGPVKQRNGVEPDNIPAAGLIILRDGEPGEPVDVTTSPVHYHYEHPAQVEVYVQQGTASARDSTLDTILRGVADAVGADLTLGSVVDWAEVREPEILDEEPVEGGNDIKRALVPVVLHYATTNPLK